MELVFFKEGKHLRSNYWLQTLILDKKHRFLKNKILKYCFQKKFYLRPSWKLISSLKPYQKKQKMNLSGSKEIINSVINLPSSQSIFIK